MDQPPAPVAAFVPPEPLADAAALLAALPWGVLVLDGQGVLRYLNPQAAAWCGVAAAALLGQPLAEAPLPPALVAALRQLPPEATTPREVWLPGTRQWLRVRAVPAAAGQHWVFLENATASHEAEAARQRSTQLLLDMEAVAHTGSYEADLASGSFYFSDGLYRLFGEAPQAFEVTLEAIDARSHPADAATVRQVLDEAVRTRQPYSYRRRIQRTDGAWRTLEAHGEVRCDATGQPVQLRGLVQDITERVQAEQARRAGHELLQRTIDSSLDLVQVFEAVRDEQGAVVDFTWVLNNDAAEQVYGDVIGQRLCEHNPGVVAEGIFDTFKQVLATGVPDQREHHYRHEQFDGWFYQSAVKLGDGVATTTRDISERKQAHEEILRLKDELAQQATDKYYALFRSMDQGFCVLEMLFDDAGQQAIGFKALEVNPRFAQESGMAAYAAGDTPRELVPALDDFWLAAYGQVVRTGEAYRQERYEPRVNRWFDVHAFRIGPPAARQVAVLFSDITARKQTEQQQQFLLRFSDALRAEPSVAAVANRALSLLIEQLGLDRSYVTTYHLDENRADVDYQLGNDRVAPLPGYFVLSDYPEAFKTTHSHTVVIEDDFERRNLTEAEKRNSAKLGMRAMVGATLRKEHHPLWSLVAINAHPRSWTPGEVALIEEVAERTWQALERARAEEALAASETQFRTVANLVPDLLWRSLPDSDTTWYNEQWYDYTGQTPETAAGYGWTDVIHPDDRAESARRYRAALASGQLLRLEHRLRSAQGEYRWFQVRARPLRNEHGAVTAWYGAATDIHARKLAELRLRRDAEADAFRVQFHEVLRPLADAAEIQEATARLLREWLDAGWCYYNEFDGTGTVATVARAAMRDGLPSFVGVRDLSGVPGYLAHLRAGHVFNAPDITASDLFSQAAIEHYLALGVRAAVGVPLVKAGQLLAVLVVADTVVREWSADAVAMLQEVAERTWATVARARTETALRESELKYRTLFDSIDEGFALEELVYDANGEIEDIIFREVNRAYERQGGLTNVVGKSIREVLPNLEQHWKDVYARVARTGEPVRLINYAQDVDRWFDTYLTPLVGSSQYVAVVFKDITERKQRELSTALLDEIGKDLALLSAPDELMQTVGKRLSEFLDLSGCYFVDVDEAKNEVSVHYVWANGNVPSLMQTFKLEEYLSADFLHSMRAGAVFVLRDTAQDSRAEAESYARLKIGSFVTVPFFRQGRYIGHIAVTTEQAHDWQPQEIQLLQEISSRIFPRIERARIEEALRESEEKYRQIFENIDQGFSLHELLVDDNGQVTDVILLEVNEAFERHTGLKNAQGKKASEVVPNLEQGWLDAMTRTYKEGESQHFEAYNADTNRWLTSQYSRIGGAGSRLLSVVFTDVTERKQREQHQEFLLKLSDALRPLATSAALERAALHVLGETLGADRVFLATMQADGASWSVREEYTAGLPGFLGTYPLSEFQRKRLPQWQAGQLSSVADSEADPTFSAADRAAYAAFGLRAAIGVPLVKGGRFTALLCVNQATPRRWTTAELALTSEAAERIWVALERARAEEALAASEQRQRALIANLPGAAAFVVGPDLRYQLAGGEALDAAGLAPADLLGCTVAEAMPPALVPQYEAHYRQALAGQDFALEHTAHGRTFISRGVPLLGAAGQPEAVLVVSYDISARKQAEEALRASQAQLAELNTQLEQRVARRTQQLQTSRDLLQSVLDTSLISMSVLYAVRDETGEVQDFRLALVNKKLERETGRTNLVGKLYAQEYPGVRQVGLFDLMLRALATNEPQTLEYFYDHEGFNRWYTCQFVKMGDGVVATNLDITERKIAEQERLKNLRLLEQAEAVAGLGSWDYELATGHMRWSSGMYHLVGLPLGQPVSPEVYLQFVVDDDRPRAEQLVRRLTAGQNAEQTLRLRVGEQLKTVRLKAVVLRDAAGQPARVLGVDLDISELQRLEADNLRLRLGQQQALFEAAQAAQEEERRRMSESLHNGIGQILYATKLQLDRLPADADFSPRHRAAELLGEAIRQTRALSHELTPATLEEFGLEATLRSMCTTLSTPALRWRCQLVLDEGPALPPPLQLAVYRLAQELTQNVLKHAHATAATLEVEVLPGWVVLRVEDNGRGFDPAQTSDGLGLRTLRSRAALLGGNVRVATTPGQGTQCQVRLPLATGFL
jgi:PAS domain S-box-containing protein